LVTLTEVQTHRAGLPTSAELTCIVKYRVYNLHGHVNNRQAIGVAVAHRPAPKYCDRTVRSIGFIVTVRGLQLTPHECTLTVSHTCASLSATAVHRISILPTPGVR